jgi:hypothetical protein
MTPEEIQKLLGLEDAVVIARSVEALGDTRMFFLLERNQRYLSVFHDFNEPHRPCISIEGPDGTWSYGWNKPPVDKDYWWTHSGALIHHINTGIIGRTGWNRPYRSYVESIEAKFK